MKLFVAILAVLAVCATNSQGRLTLGGAIKSMTGFGQDGKVEIAANVNVVYT